jgi:Domain of unknown function (DUF4129)
MVSSASDGPGALARSQARTILAERRFHLAPVPRPLHGVLHALGKALEAPLGAIEEVVSRLAVITPGGPAVVWGGLAALVLLVSGLLAVRGSRRALVDSATAATTAAVSPMGAAELERAAVGAERDARYEDAVRFRFRAGLMRLTEQGVVEVAPSMINAEVSRVLQSPRFDDLARRFDEIAYGGRSAVEEDVEASRREWRTLLRSAQRG